MKNINLVAYYTLKEILKSRILFFVGMLGFISLVFTYVASEFTYDTITRVALDIGLGLLTISSNIIAVFLGANLIPKELETRTIYMIISRPIDRTKFLIGKILGLLAYLFLNVLILSTMTLSIYFILGGESQALIYWNIFYIYLEASLLLSVVVFFSMITNVNLTVFFSLVTLLAGHTLHEAADTLFTKTRPMLKMLFQVLDWIIPSFSKLNIKDFVLYEKTLDWSYLLGHSLYGILYICALMLLASALFNRKNLD